MSALYILYLHKPPESTNQTAAERMQFAHMPRGKPSGV